MRRPTDTHDSVRWALASQPHIRWGAAARAFAVVLWAAGAAMTDEPTIARFRLQAPGTPGREIQQASGLCFGRIGMREGLWMVCDRNGDASAGRIHFIGRQTLVEAEPDQTLTADEEFIITPPPKGWRAFRTEHSMLDADVIDHLEQRVAAGAGHRDGPRLDLEAVTIGRCFDAPKQDRLFVVAEEPYSLVLELEIEPHPSVEVETEPSGERAAVPGNAALMCVFRYHEDENEHGLDTNDGLEGLAYAGRIGWFWWAEEGTRPHQADAHPRLFFSHPRIGVARLYAGEVQVHGRISERVSANVRRQRDGKAQTLNALCVAPDGMFLAVDRNGGWILRIDPRDFSAERWLNLYNICGQNLRQVLAEFPAERRMSYVSIEGIAVDENGNLWLVDDPAMPESFRASCLVRISGLSELARAGGMRLSLPDERVPGGTGPADR